MRTSSNWIMTFSGRKFWPTDPDPDDIHIADIAHALSRICRFTGHIQGEWYSVAQHSVHVSQSLPHEFKLWGLLHDAAEAYLADIAKPIKVHLPECGRLEERLHECVAEKFGLVWPMPSEVKEADRRMLVTEARQIMHPNFFDGKMLFDDPLDIEIKCWHPNVARRRFLYEFANLTGDHRSNT